MPQISPSRLFELYILDTLGKLPACEQERLARLAPELCDRHGGSGTWREAVEAMMKLPWDAEIQIMADWRWSKGQATSRGAELSACEFARDFAARHLPPDMSGPPTR